MTAEAQTRSHADLTQRDTHFEFGANWLDYLEQVSDRNIREAVCSLERLFPDGELRGRRFLDIGCGSGLSLLAALRLGAREVVGLDIDENSVEASRRCLTRFAPGAQWQVWRASVFDLDPERHGQYDVVHSWGVLHHTGDLWQALARASSLVSGQGLLAIALYRKRPMCAFWRIEKRFYSQAPRWVQAPVRWLFQALSLVNKIRRGMNPYTFIRDYPKRRGMSWKHDAHDWLGGYPYESATPGETHEHLESLGFRIVRERVKEKVGLGHLGVGCNEYVAQRREHAPGPAAALAAGEIAATFRTEAPAMGETRMARTGATE